jgi:hypothetical protein
MADLRSSLPAFSNETAAADATTGPLPLKDLKKMFDDARYLMKEPRTDGELSRDYYDGKQLTPDEIKVYNDRKQPPIVINRVQRAVDGIMGVVSGGKSSPRALMRNPPDPLAEQPPQRSQQMGQPQPGQQVMGGNGGPPMAPMDAGDVASMTLRFIADTGHYEPLCIDVLENGLIEGCGAAIFEVGADKNVDALADPLGGVLFRSLFAPAGLQGCPLYGHCEVDVQRRSGAAYPKAKAAMDDFSANGVLGGLPDSTWEDRPNDGTPWVDGKKRASWSWRCTIAMAGLGIARFSTATSSWNPASALQ